MSTARFRKQGGYKQARNIGTSVFNADGGISTRSHISFHDNTENLSHLSSGTLIWKNDALKYRASDGWHTLTTGAGAPNAWQDTSSGNGIYYDASPGRVGIGTTAPAEKLDVSGNIHCRNYLKLGFGGNKLCSAVGRYALNNMNEATQQSNTAFGSGALLDLSSGNSNTAIGSQSMQSANSGTANTAVGAVSLVNNTGNYNVAFGQGSLYENINGSYNVASGTSALYNNISGEYNVATGHQALYTNTTGGANVAIGYHALYSGTTGSYNVATGWEALKSNTTGERNVAIGTSALYENTTGNKNVACGMYALYHNISGVSNVAIGHSALMGSTGPGFGTSD